MRDIDIAANRCQEWLSNSVLPLWSKIGYREEKGIFEEGLMTVDTVYNTDIIRFRVQPRQVYVFAHATKLGWFDGNTLVKNAVSKGFDNFRCNTGEFVFSTAKDLTINGEGKNAYEHAFAMLGFAWHYKITNDNTSIIKAEKCYQWFENELADRINGGFYSSLDDRCLRCQNPHMHLFEALMTLFEVTGDELWIERAGNIYELFTTKFFNGRFLREFFDSDLAPNHSNSKQVDPGHQYEWIWLLAHYEKLTGINVELQINSLLVFAQTYGHSETGLVMDEIIENGEKYRDTSRLWCQTELLKARVALYENNLSHVNEKAVVKAVDAIFKYYINPAENGLWIDQVNRDGSPVSQNAPASTLYHIFLAFSEVWRVSSKQP